MKSLHHRIYLPITGREVLDPDVTTDATKRLQARL